MSERSDPDHGMLFDLPRAAVAGSKPPEKRRPAAELPVARVVVDTPLPHLDRPFDYQVPESMHESAVPGCRVRVPFSGQTLSGYLLERADTTDFQGRLAYLHDVVSPEPVLTPEIRELARAVADRYAGTLNDVLRLAIPPRHARVEKEAAKAAEAARAVAAADDAAAEAVAEAVGETVGEAPGSDASGGDASGREGDGGPVPPADRVSLAGPGPDDDGPAPGHHGQGSDAGADRPATGHAPPREAGGGTSGSVSPVSPVSPGEDGGTSSVAAGDTGSPSAGGDSPTSPTPSGTEPTTPPDSPEPPDAPPDPGPWARYPAGPSFLEALRGGQAPRGVWRALPGPAWADAVAEAVAVTLDAGRGSVVVVPDGRDVATVDAALTARLGADRHVALTAELGPAKRYRRWLALLRGEIGAVVGTRAAMFAPVHDLGLVVLWDDGADVHSDPHAPYPHARTVLSMRAHRAGAAALIGGFTTTAEGAQLVESGWAHPIAADRETLRRRAPRVRSTDDDSELVRDEAARTARIPSLALRVARAAAAEGPVLVQVPRRGYLASLACASCREPARCESCQGPLALRSAHAMPYCRWCGRISGGWACGSCGGTRLRAGVVGARRTAEELGRAFPSLKVRTSGRDDVLTHVDGRPALVVATPGAEPVADGGYTAAVLLDGWALLGRADLRAGEEALRRWLNAAALVRPADEGGEVVVVADANVPATQALIRWDPGGFADRELADRRELGFPPAVAMASVTGGAPHVRELLDALRLPASAELLGPVPVLQGGDDDRTERALLRVPRSHIRGLTAALKAAASARSARKDEHLTQVRMDPLEVV
ncbi:primosomal protein N' [Nocardiopsis sediminis]|uniref:Probable replication restart protein PriA n=1 Tax=Nocardiopsis sediminis TaxID=1778267 RepID=A0ABV8FV09_9ACTN